MKRLSEIIKQAYRDETGAEGLEKILIIAAIVLPLLGVLLLFKDDISAWVGDEWEQTANDAGDEPRDSVNPMY
jgi:Flp pilus assembly pilin Flp